MMDPRPHTPGRLPSSPAFLFAACPALSCSMAFATPVTLSSLVRDGTAAMADSGNTLLGWMIGSGSPQIGRPGQPQSNTVNEVIP